MSVDATTADAPTPIEATGAPVDESSAAIPAATKRRFASIWAAVERFLIYAGDWLNPILVKETRQALKSFQFTITFVLVLVACWVVTMGGVAIIGPRIFYAATGSTLLAWYYSILAAALSIVVPYAAYRSLAAEREDNTYDLLSITALKPRQIISGKLGSSVVQMMVYFSAITPCVAFTYLLRGIDVPTILVLLVYTFFWSLGLSMVGILLATLTVQRFAQVFISVAFVAALLWLFAASVATAFEFVQSSYTYFGEDEFWIFTAAIGSAYFTTFALAFFAAAARITFTSENRSTALRICMLVQQAAFVGWIGYACIRFDPSGRFDMGAIVVFSAFAGIYWYIMGALITAERPGLSERVMRRLRESFFGRMFFTWLTPGPATGYMFVVANTSSLAVMAFLASALGVAFRGGPTGWPSLEDLTCLILIGWGYLVAYLGIGLMLVTLLRKIAVVTMLAAVLINFLLLLAGFGVPYAIKSMSIDLRDADYTFLQITDPFWSLYHVANDNVAEDTYTLAFVIPGVALCVLVSTMPAVIRDLQQVRVALPQRVIEDEAELHPPPEVGPANPWDE
jgi:hypothetical protein